MNAITLKRLFRRQVVSLSNCASKTCNSAQKKSGVFLVVLSLFTSMMLGASSAAFVEPPTNTGQIEKESLAENSVWVIPDANAASHGIIGYINTQHNPFEMTTLLLATQFTAKLESTRLVDRKGGACMEITATVGTEELSLRFLQTDVVQLLYKDVVVGEVSPKDKGDWNHWGTELLSDNKAYEVLLLATLDMNFMGILSDTFDYVCTGAYWSCVGQILLCELESLACVGIALGAIPACTAACAGPQAVVTPACIGCIIAAPGTVAAVCISAYNCWAAARAAGCLPW